MYINLFLELDGSRYGQDNQQANSLRLPFMRKYGLHWITVSDIRFARLPKETLAKITSRSYILGHIVVRSSHANATCNEQLNTGVV